MVHRQLTHSSVLALVVLVLLVALVPAGADAANRRISISDYRWSSPDVHVDLGEHVTWYWVGPDTMHSVTGTSDNALGFDSDPGSQQPDHVIGDQFRIDFNSPGVYQLHCKLHTTVKGTVTVSNTPGDPNTEPDPVPQSKVDRTPPRMREVRLGSHAFGRNGTSLKYSIGEVSRISADFYRYDADGKRRYDGYKTWKAHIGWNGGRFGKRSKHFRARPGSYLVKLVATDEAHNESAVKKLKFKIR